jgi:hypothetical protein
MDIQRIEDLLGVLIGLDRGVSFLGLLWASETSIIGSGWLFGALVVAT